MEKVFLGLGILLIILAGYFYWSGKIEMLNPLSDEKVLKKEKQEMKVVGFLPTWMIGKTRKYTDEIDELIFLGIEVDSEGNLIWDYQGKKINDEIYLKQKELIWKSGGKNILGIKLFKDEIIDELINSDESIENLIEQLKVLRQAQDFDGVNLDIEYQNDPRAVLSDNFVNFITKFKKANLGILSMDVLANTINKGTEEEIKKMMNNLDEIIIMAYDFHRPGVDFAGAVAPIQSNPGDRSIKEVVDKILDLNLDRRKIIMAYPLYGYEWKTYTKEFESPTKEGWCQMASLKRVSELIKSESLSSNLVVNFDELSMAPWLTFEEDGEIHQIYYENEKSLKIKLDLVRQNQLGGVGFWALGYEGDDLDINLL